MIERALSEPDPAARAQFFDTLGLRQADPRPGVALRNGLPDLLWRRVPAGSFWMGGDLHALGAWTGRSINLPSEFWMAAYPVTVAQYQAFVDDAGYSGRWRACWTSAGWAWKSRYNFGQGLDAPLDWGVPTLHRASATSRSRSTGMKRTPMRSGWRNCGEREDWPCHAQFRTHT